jgi:hypothetical protein
MEMTSSNVIMIAAGSSKFWQYQKPYVQFQLLMMGGGTALNMYRAFY